MYLKQIEIKNMKCFTDFNLDFTSEEEESGVRRWTVLLGENGVGKSALLQAIASALAGPFAMRQLLAFPGTWVRFGETYGEIKAELRWTPGDDKPDEDEQTDYSARYIVTADDIDALSYPEFSTSPPGDAFDVWPSDEALKNFPFLRQTIYAEKASGWLACGYGPFRRLSGGDDATNRIIKSGRKSARFVTLFFESAALVNIEDWLKQLYNTARDGDERNRKRLELVKQAFREKLLPRPGELLVDARRARLKINGQEPVGFNELSDGYRGMLALGVDLIRWITRAFPNAADPMVCPGVVLIDELDAHLHPKWQRRIGFWLLNKFPGLQFIVATHSPFPAQVASGKGGNILLKRTPDGIMARSDLAAVDTWRADQILRELFELESSRSPEVVQAILDFQRLHLGHKQGILSRKDQIKHQGLLQWVEKLPVIHDPEERRLAENYHQAVARHAKELKDALK